MQNEEPGARTHGRDDESRGLRGSRANRARGETLPDCGPTDAIVKVSLTTICGTDVHIWRGEYPVEQGRIVGHEPVGVIHAARRGGQRLRGRRASAGRRDHAVRHLLLLPVAHRVPVLGLRGRVGDDRRLAARQLDRRRRRPSTFASRTRRPTWRRSPTTSPTSSACCWPTSRRPGSRPPSERNVRSVRRSPYSPRARSDSAPPPAHG